MKDWPSVARWGVGTGAAAFIPILVGLLTANPAPSSLAWAVGTTGGVVAGIVGTAQAAVNQREKAQLKKSADDLKATTSEMADANLVLEDHKTSLTTEINMLQLARSSSNRALSLAGETILKILLLKDEKSVDRLLVHLLDGLHSTFESKGPVNVSFLQYHGGAKFGLPEPIQDSTRQVVYTVRESTGHMPEIASKWTIPLGAKEIGVINRVFAEEDPWQDGVLIEDTSNPALQRFAVLQNPHLAEKGVGSYCRIPLLLRKNQLGLLCVDAVKPMTLTQPEFQDVILPYGNTIASGFAAYAVALGNLGNGKQEGPSHGN